MPFSRFFRRKSPAAKEGQEPPTTKDQAQDAWLLYCEKWQDIDARPISPEEKEALKNLAYEAFLRVYKRYLNQ